MSLTKTLTILDQIQFSSEERIGICLYPSDTVKLPAMVQ